MVELKFRREIWGPWKVPRIRALVRLRDLLWQRVTRLEKLRSVIMIRLKVHPHFIISQKALKMAGPKMLR